MFTLIFLIINYFLIHSFDALIFFSEPRLKLQIESSRAVRGGADVSCSFPSAFSILSDELVENSLVSANRGNGDGGNGGIGALKKYIKLKNYFLDIDFKY